MILAILVPKVLIMCNKKIKLIKKARAVRGVRKKWI